MYLSYTQHTPTLYTHTHISSQEKRREKRKEERSGEEGRKKEKRKWKDSTPPWKPLKKLRRR